MKTIVIRPSDMARTFTLIARPDTHYFLSHDLPEFIEAISANGFIPFRNYLEKVRSGEYIPKESYSDSETDYVYLTIGQFSGSSIRFDDLTFLEDSAGEEFSNLKIKSGDLIITRSGTIGAVHIFTAPDEKVYIPSHHLAVVELPADTKQSAEYLRLFLQSEFPRKYFWAFATGKSQKEISNWSIKSMPIPRVDEPYLIADQCLNIEQEIRHLAQSIASKQQEKEEVLYSAIRKKISNIPKAAVIRSAQAEQR